MTELLHASSSGDAAAQAAGGRLLGGSRRRVTRYRRYIVIGIVSVLGLVFILALAIGFRPATQAPKGVDIEPGAEAAAAGPDFHGLASSYRGLTESPSADEGPAPNAREPGSPAPQPITPPTPEQQQNLALAQSARSANPFFAAPAASAARASIAPARETGDSRVSAVSPPLKPVEVPASALQNVQDAKRDFIANGPADPDYVAGPYKAPASPYEIKAGDIITAALLTAINSDLPGEVVAQVTRNVFDHPTGAHLLIPQGARLVGHYDSQIAYGQSRALIVWSRIVMPDGRSIDIGPMTGGDNQGASGLADRVDGHIGPLTRAIALSTAITVGGLVAQNAAARSTGNLVLTDAAGGVSTQASQAGQRFIDRDLNRQPTITIRAGWPVVVIASKDIILEPY